MAMKTVFILSCLASLFLVSCLGGDAGTEINLIFKGVCHFLISLLIVQLKPQNLLDMISGGGGCGGNCPDGNGGPSEEDNDGDCSFFDFTTWRNALSQVCLDDVPLGSPM